MTKPKSLNELNEQIRDQAEALLNRPKHWRDRDLARAFEQSLEARDQILVAEEIQKKGDKPCSQAP